MAFIILAIVLLILYKIKISQSPVVIILIVLVLSTIYANRSFDVPDTIQYYDMYCGDIIGTYEVGYLYLCEMIRETGFSFGSFLFIISFLSLFAWFYFTQKIVSKKLLLLGFVIYMSYMGIYYNGIVLRASLAILINFVGIYYGLIKERNYLIFYLCVAISMLFHVSTIFFAILPFVIQRKYSQKVLYITLIASFLFMSFNGNLGIITNFLNTIIQYLSFLGAGRLEGYIEKAAASTISLTQLKYLFTALFLVFISGYIKSDFARKKSLNMFFNIYILGVIFMFLLSFAPGTGRIAQLFLYFEFAPIILLLEGIKPQKRLLLNIFIAVLIITNFVNLFNLAPSVYNYCS